MSDTCETVLIKGAGGVATRVNKSDYDADHAEGGAKKMQLHTEDKEEQPEPQIGTPPVFPAPGLVIPPAPSAPHFGDAVAPSTASADTLMVAKDGKKFFVVRADGSKVTDFVDIDEKGYPTEGEAWAARLRAIKQPFEQTLSTPPGMPDAEKIEEAAKNATP